MSDTQRRIYEFGPFRLEGARRLLLREGEPVRLTAKAFDILQLLLEEEGRLVEKDELMRRIWPDTVVEENNLTVNMSALRKALQESPGEHRYVVTVPGRGYQFVAEVRVPEHAALPPSVADRPRQRGRALVLVLAAVTIAVAYLAGSRRPAVGRIGSIAVLPFTNLSSNPDLEYLSDGISESLISRLSQLPDLKVIAHDSAFRYKGADVDLKEAARTLGVAAILTGSVSQRGENLSISVELVNASAKTQIWGEQYNRKAADLFAVQSDISWEIADKLRLRLGPGEKQLLARRETLNPEAYELLLRGRFHFNKGSTEARLKAVAFFDRAIAVDPTYAAAYAALADAYSILGNDGLIDPKEGVRKAEAAAKKALALDDGLAEAHRALAYTRQLAWDWAGAERGYRRAIHSNPNDAEAHAGYALFLGLMGRHDQAAGEAKRAQELDPMSIRIDLWVFSTLYSARRYDEALDMVERMRELDPNHPLTRIYAGYTYAAMARYPEAIAAFEEQLKRGGADASTRIYLGYACARAGRRAEARKILAEVETGRQYFSSVELALLHAGLGETDQAFVRLERAYAGHDVQLQYLNADPLFDSLRGDPRFAHLVRRVGLAP